MVTFVKLAILITWLNHIGSCLWHPRKIRLGEGGEEREVEGERESGRGEGEGKRVVRGDREEDGKGERV